MRTESVLPCPSATLTLALAVGALFAVGCGDGDEGLRADADPGADALVNNPPNPLGEGPAPVAIGPTTDLTRAGAYVLMAKTGITNVTGSLITGGHVGMSPASSDSLTGFGETQDASTQFSTSPSVAPPGKIYTPGNSAPTPANLTSAVLSMEAAYTDAAGRTNPDELNLLDGNLTGNVVLTPGLYTWGSAVTIPDDITLAGGANDVWIFQISGVLDLATDQRILLDGGAEAANIFWAVADEVTIHPGAHFEGILLGKKGITLQTMATMDGRALSQSLVAIDDNDVTAP